ncbi:MAG: histidine--tRNA ligase [Actinomycetia bacterium]|nr:histidine--tRNA ligase [Actinomycetes bacterium]
MFRAPKGTADVLPPDSQRWRDAHRIFDELAEQFGYGLVLTPMFEDTEVFARGVGGDTEVVEKQMYTFTDKGGRSVTLRPEATASVVRAAIQAGGVQGRLKASYWGPMFRYERPQKGRLRQYYQGGVEYLGSSASKSDVEVIEFGYRYLERMKVPDVEVRLNSIGDPEDRARYENEIRAFLNDRYEDLSEDAKRRVLSNPMRVLDSKVDAEIVAGAPKPDEFLGEDASEHFAAVREGLESLAIPYALDSSLVRGLDYYNRTVWEYVPTGYDAAQSSVGGGGRYDGLFEVLGGKPTPAVGLAMGVDRILLASTGEADRPILDAYVVLVDESRRLDARRLVSELRNASLRVDLTDVARSVKAQFKEADRRRAAAVLVIGDEWAVGRVAAKDLTSGEQSEIETKEIIAWLQAR